jgi:hypothetical protein
MDAESFFSRWSRRKTEARQEEQKPADAGDAENTQNTQPPAEKPQTPPPTMQDVEKLTHSSDFSPFVARQVDEIIRRAAMKKLFTDPRFNIMDGLDVYIEDYNKFEPLTPEALVELNHAEALLNPIVEPKHKLMQLLDLEPKDAQSDTQQQPGDDTGTAEELKTATPASPPSPDTPPHDDKV